MSLYLNYLHIFVYVQTVFLMYSFFYLLVRSSCATALYFIKCLYSERCI